MAELPLQQVMEEALQREDLNGMVLNPWGRSATLDKGLLRGLLYAHGPEDAPGEAEARQGRQLAAQGRWAEAEPLFAASAALGCPEGLRRLAGCYDHGPGHRPGPAQGHDPVAQGPPPRGTCWPRWP